MRNPRRGPSFAAAATQFWGGWLLTLAGVVSAVTMPAKAGTLPVPSTFAECSADGNSSFGSLGCTAGGIPGVPSSMSAGVTLSPIAVQAEAASPINGAFGAGGRAFITYSFQVTGGNPGDLVPILIEASLVAASSPNSSAVAELSVRTTATGNLPPIYGVCTPSCTGLGLLPFPGTVSTTAFSGSAGDTVTLSVSVSAAATHQFNETAGAFADPYIFVDPSFPNANLYSIVVSPGVDNSPTAPASAPEPASGALFALGGLCWGAARLRGCLRR